MAKKFTCKCGGKLQLVQEVSGSFVYDVDEDGKFDWDNRDFYGDTNEFVECSKCKELIDAGVDPDKYEQLKFEE